MQTKPRRAGVVFETNLEACGGTLVLLQDPADLSVHRRRVEAPLGAADAAGKAGEGGFNAAAEFVVDRLLFAAPFGRATQDDGLPGLTAVGEFDVNAIADPAPALRSGQRGCEPLQFRLWRADDVTPASLAQPCQIIRARHTAVADPHASEHAVPGFHRGDDGLQ